MESREYRVYILRCSDGSYYTGVTGDYEKRFAEHQSGHDPGSYTFKMRPVELVYTALFEDIHEAIRWEHQLKGWSRKKKEAVIRGEWEALPGLAKKDFSKLKNSCP